MVSSLDRYVNHLREALMEAYPESRDVPHEALYMGPMENDPFGQNASDNRVFVVHYRGQNFFVEYAPLFVVYTVLLLYVYLSVSK